MRCGDSFGYSYLFRRARCLVWSLGRPVITSRSAFSAPISFTKSISALAPGRCNRKIAHGDDVHTDHQRLHQDQLMRPESFDPHTVWQCYVGYVNRYVVRDALRMAENRFVSASGPQFWSHRSSGIPEGSEHMRRGKPSRPPNIRNLALIDQLVMSRKR